MLLLLLLLLLLLRAFNLQYQLRLRLQPLSRWRHLATLTTALSRGKECFAQEQCVLLHQLFHQHRPTLQHSGQVGSFTLQKNRSGCLSRSRTSTVDVFITP